MIMILRDEKNISRLEINIRFASIVKSFSREKLGIWDGIRCWWSKRYKTEEKFHERCQETDIGEKYGRGLCFWSKKTAPMEMSFFPGFSTDQ